MSVRVHKFNFLFENTGPEVADMLNLFLEVHKFEGSRILKVLNGSA